MACHGLSPRAKRSRSTRAHDSFDSRCPLSIASTTLRPSRKAPTITSSAALLSSSPAFTYRPSGQGYTTSRLSNRRLRHVSYSNCHFARSRPIDHAHHRAVGNMGTFSVRDSTRAKKRLAFSDQIATIRPASETPTIAPESLSNDSALQ